MSRHGFHQTQAWRNLRDRVVAEAERAGLPCSICGHPIAFDASGRTAWGPSVDHIVSVALAPERALDPGNLRVCHRSCNKSPTMRQVAAQADAYRGIAAPTRAAEPPATAKPWQRAYATRMAAEGGTAVGVYLSASRPWGCDWTAEDYARGLVDEAGRRR